MTESTTDNIGIIILAAGYSKRFNSDKRQARLQSGETLTNFHQLLAPCLITGHIDFSLLVPSQRVAHIAENLGYDKVLVSAGASDQAICDTLAGMS